MDYFQVACDAVRKENAKILNQERLKAAYAMYAKKLASADTFIQKMDILYDIMWYIHSEGDLTINEDRWLKDKMINEIDDFMGR